MLSDSEDSEEMAPGVVAEQNGRTQDSYHSRQRFQHYSVPQNLKEESERLKTFVNWKVSFLDSKKLAEGGFYYTNRDDVVKCAFCGVEIGYWKQGDDPYEEHMRLKKKKCPLVKDREGGTSEVQEETEAEESEVPSQDVCGFYGLAIRPFSAPERPSKTPFVIESSDLWRNFEELGVSKISGPVTPRFATYNSRIKTFENWPIPEIQSPENLAEAGFYYVLVSDNVLCFHCGGGLKNWEAGDDPWVEHAHWFSRCGFVILRKGREFVNEVLSREYAQLTVEPRKAITEKKEEVKKKDEEENKKKNAEKKEIVSTSSSEIPSNSSTSGSEKESLSPKSSVSEDKELELCRICYVRKRGIVFLPCGHFFSCTECAPSLSTCAVCRKPFEATVRAYLS